MNFDQDGNPTGMKNEEAVESTTQPQIAAQNGRTPHVEAEHKSDGLEKLLWAAKQDGPMKAEYDAIDPNNIISLDELRLYARGKAMEAIKAYVTAEDARGRTVMELREIYVEEFLYRYKEHLEGMELLGELPDEITVKFMRVGREDRKRDDQIGKDLSPRQLSYQAVLRVDELLGGDTRDYDYILKVEKFVNIYLDAYKGKKEVQEGLQAASGRF